MLKEEAVPTVFDLSSHKKVTDVPNTSKSNNAVKNSARLERLQRKSWNKEIQEVCESID